MDIDLSISYLTARIIKVHVLTQYGSYYITPPLLNFVQFSLLISSLQAILHSNDSLGEENTTPKNE